MNILAALLLCNLTSLSCNGDECPQHIPSNRTLIYRLPCERQTQCTGSSCSAVGSCTVQVSSRVSHDASHDVVVLDDENFDKYRLNRSYAQQASISSEHGCYVAFLQSNILYVVFRCYDPRGCDVYFDIRVG